MNYAAIGQIIGHEITHGFDDQGRQFDDDGNLADWWDKNTQEKFLEKAKCIIHQYGNFTDAKSGLSVEKNYSITSTAANLNTFFLFAVERYQHSR